MCKVDALAVQKALACFPLSFPPFFSSTECDCHQCRTAAMQVMTYGPDNNDPGWVLQQRELGVSGVIVDDVAGTVNCLDIMHGGSSPLSTVSEGPMLKVQLAS
jgi:hypothetical protein